MLAAIWTPAGSKGAPKMHQEDRRTNRKGAWRSKVVRKGTQREPKASWIVLKGNQTEAKREQREPKASHRATKMHPKVDVRNILAKWNENGSVGHSFWEPFGYHFPLKMHIKTNANFNAEKLQTFMRKCSQNHAKTRSKINDKSMKCWNLRFLVFSEEYNVKIVFSHDQGSQKSIKNQ